MKKSMNKGIESVLRFVNLATSGLLAGSLSFGRSPLMPGREQEVVSPSIFTRGSEGAGNRRARYEDAIGPVAIASSMILAIGTGARQPWGKVLDLTCAAGLAGVLATTTLGTARLKKKMDEETPLDYESQSSKSLNRVWGRVHSTRTALGVTAFLCAAAASALRRS